ncbi:hypothetical protein [uncultured Helicobacter sp.]|uniref:hypothetical protein n=1 Tax=uncultured Helicobacter sp. TaxID=175537 RepID=UPI00374E6D46
MQVLLWQNLVSLAESESLLTPLTRSYIESRARFYDCLVSARQERDLAMEQIL